MITLDYADKRPLYEQTKEKLRELIISGVLKPHDKIPSVRELATKLSINPNTIQKAYHELEKEGYIYSVAAKGNYVSPRESTDAGNAARMDELYGNLRGLLSEMKFLGAHKDDILLIADEVFTTNNDDKNK